MSLQLIFFILLHTHISKAVSLRIFFPICPGSSCTEKHTLHIIALIILFFKFFFKLLLYNFFRWLRPFYSHANLYSTRMFLRTQNLIGKKRLLNRNSFTKRDESEILNVINENKMSKSKCQKLIIKCYW